MRIRGHPRSCVYEQTILLSATKPITTWPEYVYCIFYALGLLLLALLPAGMMRNNLTLFLRLPTVSKKAKTNGYRGP